MGNLGSGRLVSGILAALVGSAGGRLLTVGTVAGSPTYYGYQSASSTGSLSPIEFLSTVIAQIVWGNNELIMSISNAAQPNSGWETININGTIFLRTSASYSAGSWTWSGISTNPIGTTNGSVIPVNIA